MDLTKRLETLRRLLDKKAQQPQVEEVVDAVFDEPPADAAIPVSMLSQVDPMRKPESLEGLSYGEILLLENDGLLTQAEQEWLCYKNPPYPDGTMRLPNIKLLSRRKPK
jgi:hypothetical protein